MEDDERRSGSVKRSSLGMPPCIPNKNTRRLKHLSLGMPPCIPFSINNYQFVLRSTIFLSLHALCAMLGASCSLLFSFLQLCLLFITIQTPAYFVWERNTLHFNLEHIIGFFMLTFIFLCVFFIFSQLLSCIALSFHVYLFQKILFSLLLELSLVFMLTCLESWLVVLSYVS